MSRRLLASFGTELVLYLECNVKCYSMSLRLDITTSNVLEHSSSIIFFYLFNCTELLQELKDVGRQKILYKFKRK